MLHSISANKPALLSQGFKASSANFDPFNREMPNLSADENTVSTESDHGFTRGEPSTFARAHRKRKTTASQSDLENGLLIPERRKVPSNREIEATEGKFVRFLFCLGLDPGYTSADLSFLLTLLSIEKRLVEPLELKDLEDRRGPNAPRVVDVLGRIKVPFAYLGVPVDPSLASGSQLAHGPICEQCRHLRLSYIFGHDATVADMAHFKSYPRAVFDLKHVSRNLERCEVCRFLHECISIEQSNGNPSKPKVKPLRVSEFCGLKIKKEFLDGPCLVFASKKEDRQGCILPAGAHCSLVRWAATVTGRKIEPDKINYDVIAQWLSFCRERHVEQCQPRGASRAFSLRLIDCRKRKIVPLPCQGAEYLALSYVWGPSPESCPKDSSSLPDIAAKVIEDAMIVTQKLGFDFLWVDRHCLPQDDPKEKQCQLKNMGLIYSQSVLTIICAAGDGPDFGLPGVSSTRRIRQPTLRWGNQELVYCLTKGARREVRSTKWNTRGWTYQEGLLAQRRLVFTERHIYFQCQAMHQTETVAAQLDHFPAGNVFAQSIDFGIAFPSTQELQQGTKYLQNRIYEFAQRQFTFDSDALDAFRGILALVEELPKPMYHFSGIPLFSRQCFADPDGETAVRILGRGLSWHFRSPMIRRPGFPSWTWVGWKSSSSNTTSAVTSSGCFRIIDHPESCQFRLGASGEPADIQGFSATIEFKDGERCDWDEDSMHRLQTEILPNNPPTHLLLTGWLFETVVKRVTPEPGTFQWDHAHRRIPYWVFQQPENLSAVDFDPPARFPLLSGLDEVAAGLDPSGQPLSALVLRMEAGQLEPIWWPSEDANRTAMLLLLMKKLHGETTFERIDCSLAYIPGRFTLQSTTEAKIGCLSLINKRIRLA